MLPYSSKKIGVVDYNVSNTASVIRALDLLNIQNTVLTEASHFYKVDSIILPGVGSFNEGIASLRVNDLELALKENVILKKKPILGICLGLQLLGESSAEGNSSGLGLIKGKSVCLKNKTAGRLKLPHTGWNEVRIQRDKAMFDLLGCNPSFYFNHSYQFIPEEESAVVGQTHHISKINAIIRVGNIFGTQFHPEKSYEFGKAMFEIFSIYDA